MKKEQVIRDVLEEFNSIGVRYCILRKYQSLDSGIYEDNEIDILVEENKIKKAEEILRDKSFKKENKLSYINHHIFKRFIPNEKSFFIFDIKRNLSFLDIVYLSGEEIIKNRVKKSWFFIPSRDDEVVALILHSIINKGIFREEYKRLIENYIKENDGLKYIKKKLDSINKKIYPLLLKKDYNGLTNLRTRIIAKNLMNINNLLSFLGFLMLYLFRKISVLNPFSKGILISFSGTDGSGKSTISKEIVRLFNENNIKSDYVYMGWRNYIIPRDTISKAYDKRIEGNISKRRKSILFVFADLFVFFEMYLRYLFWIFIRLRNNEFVVCDRYIYDRLIYKNVTNIGRFLILKLYPKPDYNFYLYGDPKKVYDRKKEISLDDTKRQMRMFKKIKNDVGFIEIKNEDINETISRIINEIYKD